MFYWFCFKPASWQLNKHTQYCLYWDVMGWPWLSHQVPIRPLYHFTSSKGQREKIQLKCNVLKKQEDHLTILSWAKHVSLGEINLLHINCKREAWWETKTKLEISSPHCSLFLYSALSYLPLVPSHMGDGKIVVAVSLKLFISAFPFSSHVFTALVKKKKAQSAWWP